MTHERKVIIKYYDCTFKNFGITAQELCRLLTSSAFPFWAMKNFQHQCSRLNLQTPPTPPDTESPSKKNICSHFLPHGTASEPTTAKATQVERGCASFPTSTCRISGFCLSSCFYLFLSQGPKDLAASF